MAHHTCDGLTHGTAAGGRIYLWNPEFTNVDGPTPTFAFGPGQVLHSRDMDSMANGGHAFGTAPCGRILQFTCIGRQYPPSPLDTARHSTPGTWTPWPTADTNF
jgi:hypothetical protein